MSACFVIVGGRISFGVPGRERRGKKSQHDAKRQQGADGAIAPKLRIGAKLLTTSEPRPMAVVAAASVQGSHPMRSAAPGRLFGRVRLARIEVVVDQVNPARDCHDLDQRGQDDQERAHLVAAQVNQSERRAFAVQRKSKDQQCGPAATSSTTNRERTSRWPTEPRNDPGTRRWPDRPSSHRPPAHPDVENRAVSGSARPALRESDRRRGRVRPARQASA